MCGLAGYAALKYNPALGVAAIVLAVLNEQRGTDSWGATDGQQIIKDVGPISQGVRKIPFDKHNIVAMHTRAKTVGKISKENAHPWRIGSVIGMHNGGVGNWEDLNKKYNRNYEVDSMQIFAEIDAGRADLREIRGSGAITFFKNNELYLSKFNGGSLTIARIKDFPGIVWSSDKAHLERGLDAAGLDFVEYKLKDNEIYIYDTEKGVIERCPQKISTMKIAETVRPHQQHHSNYGHAGRAFHTDQGYANSGCYRFFQNEIVWARCYHSFSCGCYYQADRQDSKIVKDPNKKLKEVSDPFGWFEPENKIWVHCNHDFARIDRTDIRHIADFDEKTLASLVCACMPRCLWVEEFNKSNTTTAVVLKKEEAAPVVAGTTGNA